MNTALIEITIKDLQNEAFVGSLTGLANHKFTDFAAGYKVKKILDLVDAESRKAGKAWAFQKSKVEMVPIKPDEPNGQKMPKDLVAFDVLQAEFLATKCEVGNRYKLHINELIGYPLSAVEMMALGPVLEGWEVLEKEGEHGGKINEESNEETSKES